MKYNIVLGILYVLILSGCQKKEGLLVPSKPPFTDDTISLEEAASGDISFPPGTTLLRIQPLRDEKTAVAYEVVSSFDYLAEFYFVEMHRLGWRKNFIGKDDQEQVLVFVKPKKSCAIFMRRSSPDEMIFVKMFFGQSEMITDDNYSISSSDDSLSYSIPIGSL